MTHAIVLAGTGHSADFVGGAPTAPAVLNDQSAIGLPPDTAIRMLSESQQ